MAQTFREFLDQLRLATDIVEVVGQYVELKRAGSRFKALCPFHQEKTPSFTVSPERQSFYCFGCNVGGDAIEFLKRIENLDWRDAVERLARRYGLEVPRLGSKDEDEKQRKLREALYAANALAARFYAELLGHPERGREAREYLAQRGLDEQTIEKFALGLSPQGWDNLLRAGKAKGFSEDSMAEAGLLVRNEKGSVFDRFRGRIIFPICDPTGRSIAFGGRVFGAEAPAPDTPKYINSPETPLYRKGQCLYALHLAVDSIRAKGQAIVLEGYTDVIALHQHGFDNAVASLGTALTHDQARLLRRSCREVIFLYDDDEAGRNAMLRGTEILLAHEMAVRCVGLREGEDPDSFLRTQGREAFAERLARAKPFFEYFLDLARSRCDLRTVQGRTAAADLLAPLIKAVRNAIEAEDYVQRLAQALQIAPDVLRAHLRPDVAQRRGKSAADLRQALAAQPPDRPHRAELALLRILIDHSQLRGILSGFDLEWIEDPRARVWIRRILDWPSNVLIRWEELLEAGQDEEERTFLRSVALMDESVANPEAMIRQSLARLKLRWNKKRARLLAQGLYAAGPAATEETGRRMDEIHQLQKERHAVNREIIGSETALPPSAQ